MGAVSPRVGIANFQNPYKLIFFGKGNTDNTPNKYDLVFFWNPFFFSFFLKIPIFLEKCDKTQQIPGLSQEIMSFKYL